jgi:hypothetical protein
MTIPTATHFGELKIGDLVLPCAVLPGGTRVISQGAMATAFGPVTGGWQMRKRAENEHAGELPPFMVAESLKPFIPNDLRTLVSSPHKYKDPRGGPIRIGFDATLLPKVCDVWLKAREKNALTKIQKPVADRAEILMRGLAHVGIIALIDEVTGYEEIRDELALQAILDAYLRKELAAWAKRFPNEFYQQMFRLKGWQWKGMSVNRPSIVGKFTNDLVYERLAPGVLKELQTRNPKDEKGRRPVKHHQWLTEDVGHPALAQHLHAVIGFMRASSQWEQFYRLMQRAFPKKGNTIELALTDKRGEPL